MNLQTTVWVELVPQYYGDWSDTPHSVKPGRLLKKRPPQADRPRFVQVVISVPEERFRPIAGVML